MQGFLPNWQAKDGANSCVFEPGKDNSTNWKRCNGDWKHVHAVFELVPQPGTSFVKYGAGFVVA